MKEIKKKIAVITASFTISALPFFTTVMAKPTPNTEGLKSESKPWIDSFTDFALWLIPSVGIIACIAHGFSWMAKEEDEKEQKPIRKTLKKIVSWTLVIEMVPTIFKILNL